MPISRKHKEQIIAPILWGIGGVIAFHLACIHAWLAPLMVVFFFCLIQASQHGCGRKNFYLGMVIGLLIYGWQLRFFLNIFSLAAVMLWLVLSFWIGFFMALANHYQRKRSILLQITLLVCSWMTLEYIRGELYYLRFTWVTPGMAFSLTPTLEWSSWLGVYGISAVCLFIASLGLFFPFKKRCYWIVGATLGIACLMFLPTNKTDQAQAMSNTMEVGGLHVEDPGSPESLKALNAFMSRHPNTDLIILAEYAFFGEPPIALRDWCRTNQVHMVVGGTQPLSNDQYYNTAFVISSEGDIVHKQVKSVPIQFFHDGLPAKKQEIWESPWGPMGICICYDLSYTRVTDTLIRKGATMILVPTLDELHWGRSQHELHARIAPMRSAEYAVPILRVGACGISQAVDSDGTIQATTTFPGKDGSIHTILTPASKSRMPLDRYLIWVAFTMSLLDLLMLGWKKLQSRPTSSESRVQTE